MEWELIGSAGRRLMEKLAAHRRERIAANDNVEAQLDLFDRAADELQIIAAEKRPNRRKRRHKTGVPAKAAKVARERPAADDRSHRLPTARTDRHVER